MVTDNEGTARRIWATVVGEGVAYSSDGGASFTVYSTGLASLELTSLEIENLGTARRIWATMHGGDGVAYSDDLGQTWTTAAGNGLTDRNINDLAIDSGTARRIWATADTGVFFEFQLKGLASMGRRLDSLLDDAIIGYRKREDHFGL